MAQINDEDLLERPNPPLPPPAGQVGCNVDLTKNFKKTPPPLQKPQVC